MDWMLLLGTRIRGNILILSATSLKEEVTTCTYTYEDEKRAITSIDTSATYTSQGHE